jgi:type IV pilus assembly protein PilM
VGNTHTQTLFYKDKPIFGFDIGFNTMKVMQIESTNKGSQVLGYGVNTFDAAAVKDGEIIDYETLAKSAIELFDKNIIGSINTRRVVATIPASKAFSRVVTVPAKQTKEELRNQIKSEAEQYIPISIDELYLDYMVTNTHGDEKEVLVVAIPKNIADSYMRFFELIGLEVCALETTISAASRIIARVENSADIPTMLIDLGSLSVDLTVFDKNLVVNGTIPGGGDDFSNRISEKLGISKGEANYL